MPNTSPAPRTALKKKFWRKKKVTILTAIFFSLITFISLIISNFSTTHVLANSNFDTVFEDDFSNGFDKWRKYGSPEPVIHSTIKNKINVFDNNGDPNYNSGVISKETVNFSGALIIESEVYLDISNMGGCWAGPSIGLTRASNPTTGSTGFSGNVGINMTMHYEGDACWATPAEKRRHSYFNLYVYAEDGNYESPTVHSLSADDYVNSWHKLKIEVTPANYVKFYADDNLLWTSTKELHPDLRQGRNIYLGERSSGSAGKAYHDWVRVKETVNNKITLFSDNFDDGNFSSNPTWSIWNNDDYPGSVSTVNNAVKFLRTGAGGNGGEVAIEISTDISIDDSTEVIFDGKAVSRSVGNGCGWSCGEYPVNVSIYMDEENGQKVQFRYSLNYGDSIANYDSPTYKRVAQSVPQNEWIRNISYRLRKSFPNAKKITKIRLAGNGWDFEGYLDNIRIVGPNTPPTLTLTEPDGTDDTADTTYVIKWTDEDPDSDAKIALYYDPDTDNTNNNQTLIVQNLSEDEESNTYTWYLAGVAAGDYYIYGVITDGVNSAVTAYSKGVVTITNERIRLNQSNSVGLTQQGTALTAIAGEDAYGASTGVSSW